MTSGFVSSQNAHIVSVVQTDAVKRNCIKVLPHMLVVHLKRFEYDYETMTRGKIKDRYAITPPPPFLVLKHRNPEDLQDMAIPEP